MFLSTCSTPTTGIAAGTYARLREALGLVAPSARMPRGGFYFAIVRQEPIDRDHLDPEAWVRDMYVLDDLVEIGVDILNPVQCSAKGMDPAYLKARYGQPLVLWGGGFVFNTIHNIQQDVPVENLMAMFRALADAGRGGSARPGAA